MFNNAVVVFPYILLNGDVVQLKEGKVANRATLNLTLCHAILKA